MGCVPCKTTILKKRTALSPEEPDSDATQRIGFAVVYKTTYTVGARPFIVTVLSEKPDYKSEYE